MNERAELQSVLKKFVLLKGTASAVPQVTHLQCGFSRRGTLFRHEATFSALSSAPCGMSSYMWRVLKHLSD
jgi:hypothetical protein